MKYLTVGLDETETTECLRIAEERAAADSRAARSIVLPLIIQTLLRGIYLHYMLFLQQMH